MSAPLPRLQTRSCEEAPKNGNFPQGAFICPAYFLSDDASPEQEEQALSLAEQECRGEMNPKEKSLHEQLVQYKREHGIIQKANNKPSEAGPWTDYQSKGDIFDQVAAEDARQKRLSAKARAAKVRTAYPGSYDDLNDATLTKKVLAKYPNYPNYCDIKTSFIPDIKDIR